MKKFSIIKDESLLTTPLKKNIKWTRTKIIIVALAVGVPYISMIAFLVSYGIPLGGIITLISLPIIMLVAYSTIYFLTRNI